LVVLGICICYARRKEWWSLRCVGRHPIFIGVETIFLKYLSGVEKRQQCPVFGRYTRDLRVDEVCKIAVRNMKVVKYRNIASFEAAGNIVM
jgi:hypothetical protein